MSEKVKHSLIWDPYLSVSFAKHGVLDDPQIKKLLKDKKFPPFLSFDEAGDRNSFHLISFYFFTSRKYVSQDYFFHFFINFFLQNRADVTDENGAKISRSLKGISRDLKIRE